MHIPITRELIGRVMQGGWRPTLLGWGLTSAIVALAWVIVYRFAIGATSLADIAALAGVLLANLHYSNLRGAPSQPSPTGGLVNQVAIA